MADAIRKRQQHGTNFSIVAVAEGALSVEEHKQLTALKKKKLKARDKNDSKLQKKVELKRLKFGVVLGFIEQKE